MSNYKLLKYYDYSVFHTMQTCAGSCIQLKVVSSDDESTILRCTSNSSAYGSYWTVDGNTWSLHTDDSPPNGGYVSEATVSNGAGNKVKCCLYFEDSDPACKSLQINTGT